MENALALNQTRYAPSSGIPELRSAILEKVRAKNRIPADEESPIVVNGGMQGLFAAFATLLDPGDEVLMFSPYWTPVTDLVTWNGGVPVLVPTERARERGLSASLARSVTPRTRRYRCRRNSSKIGRRDTAAAATGWPRDCAPPDSRSRRRGPRSIFFRRFPRRSAPTPESRRRRFSIPPASRPCRGSFSDRRERVICASRSRWRRKRSPQVWRLC